MDLGLQAVAAWASVGQGALLIVAAGIGLATLLANRRAAKRQTVLRYFERFWTPDFVELYSFTRREWRLPRNAAHSQVEARLKRYNSLASTERISITLVMNFFEELGAVYAFGLTDRDLLLEMLGQPAIIVWVDFDWLVADLRKRSGSFVFDKWEMLQRDARTRFENLGGSPALGIAGRPLAPGRTLQPGELL